jgi:diguanylate cyclase (GGDEF)-like protein/PAS domain S-box-containing protein
MLPPLRVLYVDENPLDTLLARRHLCEPEGKTIFELTTAADIAGARALLAEPDFDIVLSDLRLPDGGGLELLTWIRERQLPVAVVILTGSGDHDSAVAALKAGADDYLIKRADYLERLPQILVAALTRFQEEMARRARPIRVLYAEHNPFDIDLTRRHLTQHAPHIHLDVVHTAAEALDRVMAEPSDQAVRYDVLLLDYRLPTIDALEAVKLLHLEGHTDLPVVLVTGQGSEEVAAQALRLGVSDYMVKHSGYLYELAPTLEKAHNAELLNREQSALRDSDRRYRELTERIAVGVYRFRVAHDGGMRFDYVSPRFCRINDLEMEAILTDAGVTLRRMHPDDSASFLARLKTASNTRLPFAWEGRTLIRGQIRWMLLESTPTTLDNGDIVWDGVQTDVTERRQAEEKLRQAAAVIASTRDGVIITDLSARIVAVNPAYCEITGYSEDEVLGKNPNLLQSGRQDRGFYQAMWASLKQTGHWRGEVWNRRKNGEIYPQWLCISTVYDAAGRPTNYVGIMTDLTHIKHTEALMERLAHYDPLTELPNRLLLQSRLNHALEQAQRNGRRLGVLLLDIDRFKTINDSLGHNEGDSLLVEVAGRLQQRLREEDTLARVGGDEFVILMEHLNRPEDAASLAQSLIDHMRPPFTLTDDKEVRVGISVGISLFPNDADDANALLRGADAAMHEAKKQGGNVYHFYTEPLTQAAHERLDLEAMLSRAMERNELVLHYQPLVSLTTGEILGCEALVRWRHPTNGLIPPARFVPVAEETGLIVPLGEWVLRSACAQAAEWYKAGHKPIVLAVNLSAKQFRDPRLVERIDALLKETGLPPKLLELEITETAIMEQGQDAIAALHALAGLGLSLAIDDFGTGYSSLAYLKRFPLHKLKIDRSFVQDIPHDRNGAEIATAVIALARSLRLEVLAEGVETVAQRDFLREQGCDAYQGFLFTPPVTAEEMGALLAKQAS